MSDGISLIKSYFNLFLLTIQNKHPKRYSYSTAYLWAMAMVKAEGSHEESNKKENKRWLAKLIKVHRNIHKRCPNKLPVVEFALNKNLEERGVGRKITLYEKEYPMLNLYAWMEEALLEMIDVVTEIATKYSLDMPINTGSLDMNGGNNPTQMDFNNL